MLLIIHTYLHKHFSCTFVSFSKSHFKVASDYFTPVEARSVNEFLEYASYD